MTRSPASTSAAGGLFLLPTLRKLLGRAEPHRGDEHSYDEVMAWEGGVLDAMVALGVMREGKRADGLYLEECLCLPWAEPIWRKHPVTGKLYGTFCCLDEQCDGWHLIEPERMRTWELDWDGLCGAVASAAKASGPRVSDAEGRITMLGTISRGEVTRELFLVRGLGRRDGAAVFGSAPRLSAAGQATVLFCGHMPQVHQRRPNWKTVLVLSEIVTLHRGKLALPVHRLFEEQGAGGQPASVSVGLTSEDLIVLQALGEKPKVAMMLADLMAAAGYSKAVVRKSIGRLAGEGLVFKPKGTSRKGTLITEKGLGLLKSRTAL